jgi:hypothetical protein
MFVVRARSKRENWMLVILRRDLVSVHSRACDRAKNESSSPLGFSLQILPLSLAGERRPDWRRSCLGRQPRVSRRSPPRVRTSSGRGGVVWNLLFRGFCGRLSVPRQWGAGGGTMRISYPAWRKRPDRGDIATCEACSFWRRYIVLCLVHESR